MSKRKNDGDDMSSSNGNGFNGLKKIRSLDAVDKQMNITQYLLTSSINSSISMRMQAHSSNLINFSVVGTAGRKECGALMNKTLFHKMCVATEKFIAEELNLSFTNINLVSGGAAWSDHIAVSLFLSGKFGGLTLYLPCRWNDDIPAHEDNGKLSWSNNPGKTANSYHREFSNAMGYNTLKDIQTAKSRGAVVVEDLRGFHSRNTRIAQSKFLLAFTWADGNVPGRGGTFDTWNKCKGCKVHLSLKML